MTTTVEKGELCKMNTYKHKVQYYETDMMKIVHHSNYIRWFEEARIEVLDAAGISYASMEDNGIMIPVLSAEAEYKMPCVFGETVLIDVNIVKYNGVKLCVEYEIWNEDRTELRTSGKTSHCFVDSDFKLISLKKKCPEIDAAFRSMVDSAPEQ